MINKLINDDCFNIFPLIDDERIDMILCDLPYGKTSAYWDIALPLDTLFAQYDRIIKPNGAIVLFGMSLFSVDLINAYRHNYRYSLIWEKHNSVGFLNAKCQPLRSHEDILVFYKKQPTYNPQMGKGEPYTVKQSSDSSLYRMKNFGKTTVNKGERFPKSVLKFKTVANNQFDDSKRIHPTQKPVPLLEYLIKTYSNEGDLILDNCSGSGMTGVACQNTKRQYILIEKDVDFYLAAKLKLKENNQKLQEMLFY